MDTELMTLSRDMARYKWATSGLRFSDLTLLSIRRLNTCLKEELKAAQRIRGTLTMCSLPMIQMSRWSVSLRCKSFYFDSREAITFYPEGFVGFAGWADDSNVAPILAAFMRWLEDETRRQSR